jgi:hypothetical protein
VVAVYILSVSGASDKCRRYPKASITERLARNEG